MDPKVSNLDNELEEAVENQEEIKSGLKIRTNLKAGAIALGSRAGSTGHGYTVGGDIQIAPVGVEVVDIANVAQVANVLKI